MLSSNVFFPGCVCELSPAATCLFSCRLIQFSLIPQCSSSAPRRRSFRLSSQPLTGSGLSTGAAVPSPSPEIGRLTGRRPARLPSSVAQRATSPLEPAASRRRSLSPPLIRRHPRRVRRTIEVPSIPPPRRSPGSPGGLPDGYCHNRGALGSTTETNPPGDPGGIPDGS